MYFRTLSDEALHERTLAAANDERRATLALLEFLAEVDERRLYNARGYSSLWEYAHKYLGYSEAQASERVAAMRLMRRIPEVREKIETNALSLTATSKLAAFVRRERCSDEKTLHLLSKVVDKPTREVERVLASEQTVAHSRPDVILSAGPGSFRISFDADEEFLELFDSIRDLQGRPDWSMNDRLKAAMREVVSRKTNQARRERAKPNKVPSDAPMNSEEKTKASRAHIDPHTETRNPRRHSHRQSTRYIPAAVRSATYLRSGGRCEFVDTQTGRRCESRFGLHLDHINPFAYGGDSSPDNIRHLCPGHNRYQAIQAFGPEKCSPAPGLR